jgi:hypothetical protein
LAFAFGPGLVATAVAQAVPQAPVTWLGGRVVVSGSVSAATASGGTDRVFNAGDYGQDTMRLVEVGLDSSIALHQAAFVTADFRAAGGIGRSDWYFRPSALLLGVRPLAGRRVTVSAGLLQTPFGRTARGYGRENVLVGLPLAYQYRSSLPARQAGAPPYPTTPRPYAADVEPAYGAEGSALPVVDTRGWNAGIRLDAGGDRARVETAVTRGSLSNPLSRGESPGWQASGRGVAQPVLGLVLGVSAARGRYARAPGSGPGLTETVLGADAEFSRDYWLVRGEVIHSRRDAWSDAARYPVEVTGLEAEARYRVAPGLYLAGRVARLWLGGGADVSRLEGGLGWAPSRPALVKLSYQYNRRPTGPGRHTLHRVGIQALVWF